MSVSFHLVHPPPVTWPHNDEGWNIPGFGPLCRRRDFRERRCGVLGLLACHTRLVPGCDQRVENRHNKEREQRADGHARDQDGSNAVAGFGPGPLTSTSGKCPKTV